MAEAGSDKEREDHQKVQQVERERARPEGLPGLLGPALADLPMPANALLGDPRLNGRGNGPVRDAVMLHAQQAYGNRAVQRVIQRQERDLTTLAILPEVDTPARDKAAGKAAEVVVAVSTESKAAFSALGERWNSSVPPRLSEAAAALGGRPGKPQIAAADAKVGTALQSAGAIADEVRARPAANDWVTNMLRNVYNVILTMQSVLKTHLGQALSLPDIHRELNGMVGTLSALGEEVATAGPAEGSTTMSEGGSTGEAATRSQTQRNPALAAAWNTSVTRLVTDAATWLEGQPGKPQIDAAHVNVDEAMGCMSDIQAGIPAGPANSVIKIKISVSRNRLNALNVQLAAHLGELRPITEIRQNLTDWIQQAREAGQDLARNAPPAAVTAPPAPAPSTPSGG